MDPYLEAPTFWSGFHTKFLMAIHQKLAAELPANYYIEIEQHVWLEDSELETPTPYKPDIFVADGEGGTTTAARTRRLTKPTLQVDLDPSVSRRRRRYLKIVDIRKSKIISVIELLSPSNKKMGEDREKYLKKRDHYFRSGTNLVEIDLLRAGHRLPLGHPQLEGADYVLLVSVAAQYPKASLWALSVRDPLPSIPVPLKPSDGELALDLADCFTGVYEVSRYAHRIDYSVPPVPSFQKADDTWARKLLASGKTARNGKR